AAIDAAKQRGILGARVNCLRIFQGRFQMPDTFEFPRMLRAVVPLVRAGNAFIFELVAHRFPRFAAIAGTLDHLAKPTTRLRGIKPVGISRRTFHMIDLPTGEVRAVDVPAFTPAIRSEDKCSFACADQYPDCAHRMFLFNGCSTCLPSPSPRAAEGRV